MTSSKGDVLETRLSELGLVINRGQTQEHAQCTRTRSPAAKIFRAKIQLKPLQNRCYAKKIWTTVINLLKWSEVLQMEGSRFNSW